MNKKQTRKYTLGDFFAGYIENIGKLTLVNVLFCLPAAVFMVILLLLNMASLVSIAVVFLIIPFMSPFFSGMLYVCSKVTRKEKIDVLKDFIKGIKENFIFSPLNSIIIYVITLGLNITFSYYHTGLEGAMMIMLFVFSLLFLVFFICYENSFLTMMVTVDLSFPELVKNSVLLVAGGLFGHIKTLISFSILGIIIYSIVMFAGNNSFLIASVAALLTLSVMPVLCSYIVVFNSFQTVEKQIIVSAEEKKETENVKKETVNTTVDKDELEKLAKGDPEEFVFLDGRMIKRKSIIKMLEKLNNINLP